MAKFNQNLKNMHIESSGDKPDKPIWKRDSKRVFTISSAWEILREKRNHHSADSKIWHKLVPLKMTLLTWRAIHNCIPTDERVSKMGFQMVAKCYCCNSHTMKNTEHLFCTGEFSKVVWTNFFAPFGITCMNVIPRLSTQFLYSWWNYRAINIVTSFVAKVLPPIVM